MARILTLRYLGNDFKFFIPNILVPEQSFVAETTAQIWAALYDEISPNLPCMVGESPASTELQYVDYYNMVSGLVGENGRNCHNIYRSVHGEWDTMWPAPLGDNKILVPPAVSGQGWFCPANGRYCTFDSNDNAIVYDEDETRITNTLDQLMVFPGTIDLIGVNDWDNFREATTFNDAKQYCGVVEISVVVGGILVNPNPVSYGYRLLRLIWDFVRHFGGDDDDPTTDSDDENDDPYSDDDSPYDPSDVGGGDGDGDDPYDPGDPILEPDVPSISIVDSGLITIYTPTNAQLADLASYLWSNDFITSMVKELYADALDVIISLGFLPFNISHGGTREIKVGDRGTGILSNYPSVKYVKFDAGSVNLKTTLGAYIDYAPYTKGDIYIPFVGYVPLDIDAFMGHTISLKYIVDITTGSAVAILKKDSDVWQQFSCNLLTQVPLSAANYAQMYQTIIGATAVLAGAGIAGAAGIGGAAVGGEAAEGAQAIASQSGGAAKAASGIMSSAATKPQIQKSNNLSLSAGLLGNKKAFIQLYRPNLALPSNQNKFQGYPSYVELTLSECSGYCRVSSINLIVAGATGTELSMIDSILKTGFVVGSGDLPSGTGIKLYKSNSPAHQIKKTLTGVASLTGTFRDSVNVLNPIVRIEHESPVDFDYVYISDFGRCYFVDDITVVRKGVLDVKLRVDVLNSFASGILANKAIVDKSSNKYNLYLNDDSLKMYQRPLIQQIEFPNALFTQTEWVLIVAGS